jgi:hypothetical protein
MGWYGLDRSGLGQGPVEGSSVPGKVRDFSLLHSVHVICVADQASCPVGYQGLFPRR